MSFRTASLRMASSELNAPFFFCSVSMRGNKGITNKLPSKTVIGKTFMNPYTWITPYLLVDMNAVAISADTCGHSLQNFESHPVVGKPQTQKHKVNRNPSVKAQDGAVRCNQILP
eukprot:1975131-Rhodomonas_salina.6